MTIRLPLAVRLFGLSTLATLLLLGTVQRTASAEKANPEECYNNTQALCQKIETCSGGFEANGTCKWIYTVTRYYWKF